MKIINSGLSFGALQNRKKTSAIILHHSANSTWGVKAIHNYHVKSKKWSGIGYHFFVDKEGNIYSGRPEDKIGAHCFNHNGYSIGICAQGNFMMEEMPDKQKAAIIMLCKYLCNKYKTTNIKAHRELNATSCPGSNFPFEEIKNKVIGC